MKKSEKFGNIIITKYKFIKEKRINRFIKYYIKIYKKSGDISITKKKNMRENYFSITIKPDIIFFHTRKIFIFFGKFITNKKIKYLK